MDNQPPAQAPLPEQPAVPATQPEVAPATQPETVPAAAEIAPSVNPMPASAAPVPLSMPAPAVPGQPVPVSATPPPAPLTGPAIADDVDVIEKEWVDQATQIINATSQDPYVEEEAIEDLQVDYLKKRYGKEVKKDPPAEPNNGLSA